MKPNPHFGAAALAIGALVTTTPERVSAQVDGFSSCQRSFDLAPGTADPTSGSCSVTGIVFLGKGQQAFFDIVGSAQAFEGAGTDLYDVQLTLSASGDYPEGFTFGRAEVRSTNGDVCEIEIGSGFEATTCENMFSSDSAFTVFVDAFSGAVPD